MADQKEMWNRIHSEGGLEEYGTKPSDYAKGVDTKLGGLSHILELGCGEGGDAAYFTTLGKTVTATDFSDTVVQRVATRFPEVECRVLDVTGDFPFADASFDVVYANLSLHYADDTGTNAIFARIARVLTDGGKLFFRCKSIHSEYEKMGAVEIAPNIYEKNGHIRHLFSTEYVKSITSGLFSLERNDYTEGDAYGHDSYFVEVEATKI